MATSGSPLIAAMTAAAARARLLVAVPPTGEITRLFTEPAAKSSSVWTAARSAGMRDIAGLFTGEDALPSPGESVRETGRAG
ncbi:hypothetical protein [Amycolatopsis orientalis]|uniref:hypothetical protein n=1 Tax=Amycolatopsis orientalis TaxID=31958 RepID=UPI000422DC18|nr:hypothetical protein [Amycolatopsis orientalis]